MHTITTDLTNEQLFELPLRELVTSLTRRLDTLEWLAMHPGAKPLTDCPGWYIVVERPEDTGGPFWRMRCFRTATAREKVITRDLYYDLMNPTDREGKTFDSIARDELARQGYPMAA